MSIDQKNMDEFVRRYYDVVDSTADTENVGDYDAGKHWVELVAAVAKAAVIADERQPEPLDNCGAWHTVWSANETLDAMFWTERAAESYRASHCPQGCVRKLTLFGVANEFNFDGAKAEDVRQQLAAARADERQPEPPPAPEPQDVPDIHDAVALRHLVNHCWVHSGYANCGYDAMDSDMRRLYEAVTAIDADAEPIANPTAEAEIARRVAEATAKAQQHVSRCHDEINTLKEQTSQLTRERDEAKQFLVGLLKICTPQCTPLDTVIGLLSQLDNYVSGLMQQIVEYDAEVARRIKDAKEPLYELMAGVDENYRKVRKIRRRQAREIARLSDENEDLMWQLEFGGDQNKETQRADALQQQLAAAQAEVERLNAVIKYDQATLARLKKEDAAATVVQNQLDDAATIDSISQREEIERLKAELAEARKPANDIIDAIAAVERNSTKRLDEMAWSDVHDMIAEACRLTSLAIHNSYLRERNARLAAEAREAAFESMVNRFCEDVRGWAIKTKIQSDTVPFPLLCLAHETQWSFMGQPTIFDTPAKCIRDKYAAYRARQEGAGNGNA